MMKKIYVIETTLILLIIFIHICYMVAGLTGGVPFNEDLAMNMGYTLMYMAILHGIYGLVKWIMVLVRRRQLQKLQTEKLPSQRAAATRMTLIQRISGIMVVVLIVPHTLIKLEMAGPLLTIIDILFMLAIVLHLLIGIPKWLVSTGLLSKKFEKKCSVLYGGKGNA